MFQTIKNLYNNLRQKVIKFIYSTKSSHKESITTPQSIDWGYSICLRYFFSIQTYKHIKNFNYKIVQRDLKYIAKGFLEYEDIHGDIINHFLEEIINLNTPFFRIQPIFELQMEGEIVFKSINSFPYESKARTKEILKLIKQEMTELYTGGMLLTKITYKVISPHSF